MQIRNTNYSSCVRDKLRGVKVLLCGENKKNVKLWEWKYLPAGAMFLVRMRMRQE